MSNKTAAEFTRRDSIERLAREINIGTALGPLLELILTEIRKSFPCDQICLLLKKPNENIEIIAFTSRIPSALRIGLQFPLEGTVYDSILKSPRPARFDNLEEEEPLSTASHPTLRDNMRSMYVFPLIVHDRTVGLASFSSSQPRIFRPEHESFLGLISRQTASALELSFLAAELVVRRQFEADLAHDLKQPLTAILGYSEMLFEGRLGELNERQRNGLSAVLRSLVRLEGMINDLLDVGRFEAGKIQVHPEPFGLKELMEGITQSFAPLILDKALAFTVRMDEPKVRVLADPRLIQRVVSNLLSNAIKFTPKGGTIALTVGAPKKNRVEVTIKDTGIGIPPEIRARLFERFARGEQGEGSGLGLSIVKGILDAHRSSIRVESASKAGTAITFDLECCTA